MAWVLASGIAMLVPVLIDGNILGPFDLLSRSGVTQQPGLPIHIYQNSDLINSLIPWWNTVWQQVHHGHLPLWNPYAGLGMPLAFNWQSAPLSVPALVGYLVPLHYAYTTGVIVNLVVAGSGAYVLGRVLGMGALASAAVGTVFELSGPFAAWLGYPFPAVLSWAGWMFAVALLLLRRRHRAGYICALALCVAAALYGGAPEGFAPLMIVFGLFLAVVLACRTKWLGGSGPILWPAIDLLAATLAGIALAAPFALPGIQVVSKSVRNGPAVTSVLKVHTLTYLFMPAFDGLPIFHHGKVVVFGYTYFYTQTAMYVGVCALVLAGIGIISRWRRPEVRGFATVLILCLVIVFTPAVSRLAGKLPLVGRTDWVRSLMPFALAVAVLAGYGIDLVVRSAAARRIGRRLGVGFALAAVILAWLWVFRRGHLAPAAASVRAHSFIWPVVETCFGLAVAGFLLFVGGTELRRRRDGDHLETGVPEKSWITRSSGLITRSSGLIAGGVLLAAQTAFLVSSGATMVQSAPHSFPQTAAARALVESVGSSTVAFGDTQCGLGFQPNVNDAYGVHELEVYDPIIPSDYYSAWNTDVGTRDGNSGLNLFCPIVNTPAVAREFGVAFVLTSAGQPAPPGEVYIRHVGDEVLYRIPGSGEATLAPLSGNELPPDNVTGTPVAVSHPSPSQWHVTTSTDSPQVLRLHLTNTPGWKATIDGRPLALEPYAGMMLQARIPAGHHTIELRYWPGALTEGIVLAVVALLFLIGLLVASSIRRRRSHRRGPNITAQQASRPE
jgi:hypothetical protein